MLTVMNKKWIIRWLAAITLLISTHRIELNSTYNAVPEKPMVIIVPSYNNRDWYEKNLASLLNQRYTNYRIIYIADCCTDDTETFVKRYVRKHDIHHRVTLICNAQRRGALANIYHAMHSCKDHEICVVCDGDDWFKHENVLQRINQEYADPHVWMTYGQFERYPYGKTGYCKDFPQVITENNAYREYDWISSHVRTCYAKLFKKIKLQDLIENGDFFDVTGDQAVMFPMLEMACGNHRCIQDVVYVYNSNNPINDYKIKLLRQMHYEKLIRAKKKYEKLSQLFEDPKNFNPDVLMISENKPADLYLFLETVAKYCSGLSAVHVLYRADSVTDQSAYEAICAEFPSAKYTQYTRHNFTESLNAVVDGISAPWLVCARDGVVIKDFIALNMCTQELEKTGAHGFYCILGKHIQENPALARTQKVPASCTIDEGICAWQFKDAEGDWRNPHNFLMTVYATDAVKKSLLALKAECIADLEAAWDKTMIDFETVGLFFDESKAVMVRENDTRYATKMFQEGMKIDAVPLFQLANAAVEIEYNGMFVRR